ncbi:MAG: glycosyltransferase family 2 protein [Leuconostoc citreum]
MKKLEINMTSVLYLLLGIGLTFDVVLSVLKQTDFYDNVRLIGFLIIPIILMTYIIGTQTGRASLYKSILLTLISSFIFAANINLFLTHSIETTPILNTVSVVAITGLQNVFSNRPSFLKLTTFRNWYFGISGCLISATAIISFITINQKLGILQFIPTILHMILAGFVSLVFGMTMIMQLHKQSQLIVVVFVMAILVALGFGFYTADSSLFFLQMTLGLLLIVETWYTGISTYFNSYQKVLLFIISSLPLLFFFRSNIEGINYFKEFFYLLIKNFTWFAVFFSVLTFIYYTIETLLLWSAYRTKYFTSDLSDVQINTEYRMVILIPCMNEAAVIKDTVKSLLATNYDALDIYVIDDASTDNTVQQVEEFKDNQKFHLLKRVKPEAQQGKGKALNWAYKKVTESYLKQGYILEDTLVTIIDADSSVDTDYFDKVNLVFNSDFELTGLQSKVQVLNKNRDVSQDLEFREIINATQSLRSRMNTVAFGGNGQFCKLSTLFALHEDPWTTSLVEDFDLSLRLFLSAIYNVRNVQYDDIQIKQTGIYNDTKALVKQRVRWAQGNVQTFKYLGKIMKSGELEKKQKLEFFFTLIKPWLMAIEYLVVIYTGIVLLGTLLLFGFNVASRSFITVFVCMVLYIFLINIVWAILYSKNTREKLSILLVLKDAYYLTRFLVILSQIYPQAILRYFNAQNTWDKTNRQN